MTKLQTKLSWLLFMAHVRCTADARSCTSLCSAAAKLSFSCLRRLMTSLPSTIYLSRELIIWLFCIEATPCLKTRHLTFDNNFDKCRPIFTSFSLLDSEQNFTHTVLYRKACTLMMLTQVDRQDSVLNPRCTLATLQTQCSPWQSVVVDSL